MGRIDESWWRGIVLAAALAASAPASALEAFIAGIDDLPLMPDLVEHADQHLSFPVAGGRILESTASGPVAPAAILAFYARALPELGWRAEGEGVWTREGERLRIEFPARRAARAATPPSLTVVRFRLVPG